MGAVKFAVSIDESLVKQLDKAVKSGSVKNRSKALQLALSEYLKKIEIEAIKNECSKLVAKEEQEMANEFIEEAESWPQY